MIKFQIKRQQFQITRNIFVTFSEEINNVHQRVHINGHSHIFQTNGMFFFRYEPMYIISIAAFILIIFCLRGMTTGNYSVWNYLSI